MPYLRFGPMVASARPYPALWRLVLGVVTLTAVAFLWMGMLFGGFTAFSHVPVTDAAIELMDPEEPRPAATLMFLLMIGGLGLGTIIAARLWQKRRAGTLFGPRVSTLRNFGIAAGTSLAVMLILGLVTMPFIETPTANLEPTRWLLWLPVALVALSIQTGSEELLFRGYLQSQLAARFKNPAIWLLIPALIFGAVHMQPGLSAPHLMTLIAVTCVFGLLAGDLTARTGNIGAAWGFHFANNALVILFVSNEPALSGLSLFRTDNLLAEMASFSPLIAFELLTLVAIWAMIRRVLAV